MWPDQLHLGGLGQITIVGCVGGVDPLPRVALRARHAKLLAGKRPDRFQHGVAHFARHVVLLLNHTLVDE